GASGASIAARGNPVVENPAEVLDEAELRANVVANAALVADPAAEAGAPENRRTLAKVDHPLVEERSPAVRAPIAGQVERLIVLHFEVIRARRHLRDLIAPAIEVLVGRAGPVTQVGIQSDVRLVNQIHQLQTVVGGVLQPVV